MNSAQPAYGVAPTYVAQPAYAAQPGPQMPMMMPMTPQLTSSPVYMVCPCCHQQDFSNAQSVPGVITYLVSFVFFPLGLIACCIDGLKDMEHRCPHCNYVFGTYKRI